MEECQWFEHYDSSCAKCGWEPPKHPTAYVISANELSMYDRLQEEATYKANLREISEKITKNAKYWP